MRIAVFAGGALEHFLEGAGESRVVSKADLTGNLGNRQVAAQHVAGEQQPLAADVLVEGIAGISLELAHQVELAGIGVRCKGVDAELIGQMLIDIGEHFLDLGIISRVFQAGEFMAFEQAVDEDHELDEQQFCVQAVGKALTMGCFFQLIHMEEQIVAGSGSLVHDAGSFTGLLEAVCKIGMLWILTLPAFEEGWRDIDDDALIVSRAWQEYGPVDLTSRDKDDVTGRKVVRFAFDDVVDIAAQKQDDFMEIVVVEGYGLQRGVLEAEHAEITGEIAFFLIITHGNAPFVAIRYKASIVQFLQYLKQKL